MEIFFECVMIFFMIVFFMVLSYMYLIIKSLSAYFELSLMNITQNLDSIKEEINRSSQAKTSQEMIKPIKPNNWDKMREFFKRPVKVDVNERD